MKYTALHENRIHGTADFPLEYHFVNSDAPRYIMDLHWHREFEMVRVIEGTFRIFLNNVEYSMQAGDIAFVGCGMLHRGEPQNCVYECLLFDPRMLCRQQNDRIASRLLPLIEGNAVVSGFLSSENSPLYATAVSLFRVCAEGASYYELSAYALLYQLFYRLYLDGRIAPAKKSRAGHQSEVIAGLLDRMERHYAEPITVSTLARQCGLNEKYLCRLFREYTGKTLIEYVNTLRIDHACREMLLEGRTVTEAAYNNGFNDLSYFSRTFKRYRGMTPREYCKRELRKQSTGSFHS